MPAPPLPDRGLIEAHQEIKDIDQKISATLKLHGEDADQRPDYLKFEDERYDAIERLSSTTAQSAEGAAVKASTLKMREVLQDHTRTTVLAESLADDVLRLSGMA
jgi:hypothetical protein